MVKHRARASFFLMGDFLVNPRFQPLVQRIVHEGHYLGPHADKHLLYYAWDDGKLTRVVEAFAADLANLDKVARFGVDRPHYFLGRTSTGTLLHIGAGRTAWKVSLPSRRTAGRSRRQRLSIRPRG